MVSLNHSLQLFPGKVIQLIFLMNKMYILNNTSSILKISSCGVQEIMRGFNTYHTKSRVTLLDFQGKGIRETVRMKLVITEA